MDMLELEPISSITNERSLCDIKESKKRKPNKPIPFLTEGQMAQFWSHVDRRGPDECWLWTGAKAQAAKYSPHVVYGIWKGFKAHRVAWTIVNGPIPDDLTLDHVRAKGCTNTLCCNFNHLEPATLQEQVRRRDLYWKPKEFCKWGHKRDPNLKTCPRCAYLACKKQKADAMAVDPEGYRRKRNEDRRRQRAAAKSRPSPASTPQHNTGAALNLPLGDFVEVSNVAL